MKHLSLPILLVTALLFALAVLAQLDTSWSDNLVILGTAVSPILIVWMVIRVLKDGEPSPYTFEDRFYEDKDYKPLP